MPTPAGEVHKAGQHPGERQQVRLDFLPGSRRQEVGPALERKVRAVFDQQLEARRSRRVTEPELDRGHRPEIAHRPVIEIASGREHGPFDSEADVALCLAFEKLRRDQVEVVNDASPMSSYASWA